MSHPRSSTAMSLLQLPAETLLQILKCAGSSFFCEEIARLTVCKQWFQFARLVCFKNLDLSQNTLQRMMRAWDVIDLRLLKDTMESLVLWLTGYKDWNALPVLFTDAGGEPDNRTAWTTLESDLTAWTATLESDLKKLATLVQGCPKLRTVRVHASNKIPIRFMLVSRHNYLTLPGIKPLISVKNLTSLDLDLCGSSLLSHPGGHLSFHICPEIAALLTVLMRLKLCMREICADVLRPPDHKSGLRLSEVIINLDLTEESKIATASQHSMSCTGLGLNFLEMKTNLEAQAKILAASMASPKIFRILFHLIPKFELLSLDVLTGKDMLLTEDIYEHKPWDADGATIMDDSDVEVESEISSLSTSFDESE
ncbi:MAG: hypothetical protein Q9165_008410 [Trypethelium subeluteriae]